MRKNIFLILFLFFALIFVFFVQKLFRANIQPLPSHIPVTHDLNGNIVDSTPNPFPEDTRDISGLEWITYKSMRGFSINLPTKSNFANGNYDDEEYAPVIISKNNGKFYVTPKYFTKLSADGKRRMIINPPDYLDSKSISMKWKIGVRKIRNEKELLALAREYFDKTCKLEKLSGGNQQTDAEYYVPNDHISCDPYGVYKILYNSDKQLGAVISLGYGCNFFYQDNCIDSDILKSFILTKP